MYYADDTRAVYGWGRADYGQLGQGKSPTKTPGQELVQHKQSGQELVGQDSSRALGLINPSKQSGQGLNVQDSSIIKESEQKLSQDKQSGEELGQDGSTKQSGQGLVQCTHLWSHLPMEIPHLKGAKQVT